MTALPPDFPRHIADGESYIRISHAYSREVLEQGLDRLEAFVGKLSGGGGKQTELAAVW